MSLRDEIEKLINAERKNLEARDAEHSEYHKRQCDRFASLHRVIEELASSIEPEYLNVRIDDDNATIQVGQRKDSLLHAQLQIKVEPNFEISSGALHGKGLFREASGFRITETHFWEFPQYDVSEQEKVLTSEHDVAEYLIRSVANMVAQYRYLASLRTKRDENS